MRLENKVALITGGMSGIGQAIACRFAEEGADIAIHDIATDGPPGVDGPTTLDMIRNAGRRVASYKVDVSRAEEVRSAISETIRDFGRIHLLVNDAGVNFYKPPFEFSDEDWERIIGVNLTGTWNYCRYLGPHLVEKGGGAIVNVASIGAFQASYWRVPYMASKGGVAMLTRALALDLAESNVRVNAVAPGTTMTPLARGALRQVRPGRTTNEMVLASTPMRRWGTPREIANCALFLASDEASFVTGEILVVDGGWLAGNQIGVPWKPVPDNASLTWLPEAGPVDGQ